MARKKKREEQHATLAVGEEALDRGVRGIDIKPIEPDPGDRASRDEQRRRHGTGRGGGTAGDEGEDSGR